MKKVVSIILTVLLIVTSTATTVFAKPAWKGGNGKFIPPGIAKKLFADSDEVKWAQQAIEKLKSKGLIRGTDGKYYPGRAVSKVEAVVMALRIMDWEDEALSIKDLPREYKGASVQQWAIGYVAIAYKKGILDDVDMMYFNPNEPAKRHEVAKYVIRALGKEDEAKAHMHDELAFVDAPAVPQGSVGYVYLVNELGIMKGDGKTFNPMGTLTRAEMAVLFNNLDEKVDSDKDVNEYTGTISSMEDNKIVVKVGTSDKTFEVSEDVVVYDGRTRIEYSDLKEGTRVLLQVSNDKVVYIQKVDIGDHGHKIISKYTGELTKIDNGDPATITVKIEGMTVIFTVIDDVDVYFKGVKGDLDELKVGDDVTVTVDNRNRASKISVNREKEVGEEEVEGTITKIDLTGEYHITIDSKEYELSEDAKVEIDDEDADLEDLAVGMEVEAQVEDGIVTSISAESVTSELEGVIEAVYGQSIKVLVNGKVKEYGYAKVVAIDVEGRSDSLSSLEKGMEVELKLENNLVTSIEAKDNRFEVDGEIDDLIKSNDTYKLELEVDGKESVYEVSGDVEIAVENIDDADMEDLKEGMKGEFEIVNNTIVKITIED